jgi:wobble nucleotide-excising tRNase
VIRSIEYIKKFGIFSDYQKSNVKDFGKNNIIFGWNYSGKTTLSRIFRSLEKRTSHTDFFDGQFKIQMDDNSEIKEDAISSNNLFLRVFNSDYIKENFNWEQIDSGVESILIPGEEKIELEKEKIILKQEIYVFNSKNEKILKRKSVIETAFDKALTDEARRMSDELSLGRVFKNPNLKLLVNDAQVISWQLDAEQLKQEKIIAQSTDKLDDIDEISHSFDDKLLDSAKDILEKKITPSKILERLRNRPDVESWVRTGIELHKDKKQCEFCSNELPITLFTEFEAHFSKDYEELRKRVEKFLDELEAQKVKFNLKSQNDFYKDIRIEYKAKCAELEIEVKRYNDDIAKLINQIKIKISKLTEVVKINTAIFLSTKEINSKIKELNQIIKKHNKKTTDFDSIKNESVEKLKKYYAFTFYVNQKCKLKNRIIKKFKEIVEINLGQIKLKEGRIAEIDALISESVKGAETLNYYLKSNFGQNCPIEIKVNSDGRFHIIRSAKEAKNLSEGEKTAIAFSYFLTSLFDKGAKSNLANTIIYIDDPISSLDSNHLYNIYAIIATFVKDKCKQLFISTHNYEFFNLLKDETDYHRLTSKDCEKKDKHNCKATFYQVERNLTNARIENLDCTLCRFKSEYQYLFYQIYQFRKDTVIDDEYKLFTAPNILRRFLETYLQFIYPASNGLKNGLNKLINNAEERKFVYKIINELSHNENTDRTLKLYSTKEIKKAVNLTLDAFEISNKNYLNELKISIGINDN